MERKTGVFAMPDLQVFEGCINSTIVSDATTAIVIRFILYLILSEIIKYWR
ncbi:hypothetical protein MBAV_005047 [Candidatus Magnetobacterium bavaricum]|uniref:Uncharacterized protein n=1 Tax=Candidatus Magnetobacterium bavaricum TaxID=29290 RepID=A0A0F3GLI5_9BACT|nr:hypothetical protein MBAV_005047 [Candidatus Magnetobacterium bavaricum]